ncbi:hypothetical protein ACQ4M3_08060 [Leptolyngbya sp. AN03gr2]|uniref:hypothetical protein n=1 Tax=unclassified Leptolyngbya TaxID=2650499 RepID=UPI003D323444
MQNPIFSSRLREALRYFNIDTLIETIKQADAGIWRDRDSLNWLANTSRNPASKIELLQELTHILEQQRQRIDHQIENLAVDVNALLDQETKAVLEPGYIVINTTTAEFEVLSSSAFDNSVRAAHSNFKDAISEIVREMDNYVEPNYKIDRNIGVYRLHQIAPEIVQLNVYEHILKNALELYETEQVKAVIQSPQTKLSENDKVLVPLAEAAKDPKAQADLLCCFDQLLKTQEPNN